MEAVDQYMQGRLHAQAWESATPDDKFRALKTAERQLLRISFGHPTPSSLFNEAIYEQALYILELNSEDVELRNTQIVTGLVAVGAAGVTESYDPVMIKKAQENELICPAAMTIIKRFGFTGTRNGRLI